MGNFELLHSHALVLTLLVLVLVGFEKLALGRLMLFILLFEVAKLPIQFIQCVFEVLNLLNGFLILRMCSHNSILISLKQLRNGSNTMIIIFKLSM